MPRAAAPSLVLAGALLLAACATDPEFRLGFTDAVCWQADGPICLEISAPPLESGGEYVVDRVQESPLEVRVEVSWTKGVDSDSDVGRGYQVGLNEPLGDRDLYINDRLLTSDSSDE